MSKHSSKISTMSDPNNKPNSTDPGTNGAAAPGGGTDAGTAADRQNGANPVLAFLKETTGRDFSSIEEAAKSVKSLNAMVGDKSIAELRKKAGAADQLEKIVHGYAKSQGLEPEDARKDLLALIEQGGQGSADPMILEKVSSVEQRLDLADLLAAHPEAKHVLDDVKDLAKARGVSFEKAYASSAALQSAAKATAASMTKEGGQPSSSKPSSHIAVNTQGKDYEAALATFKERRTESAAEDLVRAALGGK